MILQQKEDHGNECIKLSFVYRIQTLYTVKE